MADNEALTSNTENEGLSKRHSYWLSDSASKLLKNLTNGQILTVALFLMVPGIILAVLAESPSLWEKLVIALVTELGFAFFIAWVIISTVDEREKDKAIERVNSQADRLEMERKISERRLNSKMYLSHVLGLDLPTVVSEELHEYISTTKLLKREQLIKYKLRPCGRFTELIQILDAVFENVDLDNFIFRSPFNSYDNANFDIMNEFPNITWGVRGVSVYLRKKGENHWKEVYKFDRSRNDRAGQTATLVGDTDLGELEVTMGPGDRLRYHVEYATAKYAADNEIFTTVSLCENISADIQYDKNIYEVDFRSLHPRENSAEKIEGDIGDTLNFNYPFLPSHGFVVWWRKKSE